MHVFKTRVVERKGQCGTCAQYGCSAFHDQYFEIAYASWIGQGHNAIAQVVPLQERNLAAIAAARAIENGKIALPHALHLLVDAQLSQPLALRREGVQAQTLAATLVDERAEIDVRRDILLARTKQGASRQLVSVVAGERALGTITRIQFSRFIAVVDGEKKAVALAARCGTQQALRRPRHPALSVQIDLGAPTLLERCPGNLVAIEVSGYLWTARLGQ